MVLDMRKISIAIFLILLLVALFILFVLPRPAIQEPGNGEAPPLAPKLNQLPIQYSQQAGTTPRISSLTIADGAFTTRGVVGVVEETTLLQIVNQDEQEHSLSLLVPTGPFKTEPVGYLVQAKSTIEISVSPDNITTFYQLVCATCNEAGSRVLVWPLLASQPVVQISYLEGQGWSADHIVLHTQTLNQDRQIPTAFRVWNRTGNLLSFQITKPNNAGGEDVIAHALLPADSEGLALGVFQPGEYRFFCEDNCPGEINEGRIVVN